jgi:lipopolysaccharide exporter
VQKESLSSEEIRFCFWAQSCRAVVLAGVICLLAPWIAAFFETPELSSVLPAYCLIIVIQTLGLTSTNLLRRVADFRSVQLVQLGALFGSQLLVALPLAWFGAGVWSLVAAAAVSATFNAVTSYGIVRHELRPRFSKRGLGLVKTARWYLALNVVNAIQGVLPQILIGRLFDSTVVGLYDRTYSLFVAQIGRGAQAISTVLFSFFSRTNHRHTTQQDLFLVSLTLACFFGAPCAAAIARHSELLVAVTLGSKWGAAADFLPALAICIPVFLAIETTVPVLNGRGRPEIEVGIVIAMIGVFISVLVFAHDDVREIVWSLVAAYGLRLLCLLVAIKSVLGAPLESIGTALAPGMVVAALIWVGDPILVDAFSPGLPDILHLAVVVAVPGAVVLLSWLAYRAWMPSAALRRVLNGLNLERP